MKVIQDAIRLGRELERQEDAASNLWSWLPSHAVAKQHHGDYANEHRPSAADVMREASMYLAHLRRPTEPLSPEEQEWFTSCPCGDGCEASTAPQEGE